MIYGNMVIRQMQVRVGNMRSSPHSAISSVRLGLAIVPQHSVNGRYTTQEPARDKRPRELHRIHRCA